MIKMNKVGRNDPCPCGSGKKYKKCCIDMPDITEQELREVLEQIKKDAPPEPHLNLVKSLVHQGYRWRPVYSTLRYRPLTETFHEFILKRSFELFGEDWRQQEASLPQKEQHVFMRWVGSLFEWKKTSQTDSNKVDERVWAAAPSGEVKALLQFAYDIYCLEAIDRLPDFLLERVKNKNEFQGARYEIACAAIMARAGFEINFLDDQVRAERHCEFIAINKYTREQVGVEAKSRRRKGILNEKGQSEYSDLVKGDVGRLFRKACSQKPKDVPFLIFIDLNVLPSPGLSLEQKPWLPDIKAMLDHHKKSSRGKPDPFTALLLTNFSYYYAGESDGYGDEFSAVISPFPERPIQKASFDEIWQSLNRYSHIPKEV